MPSLEISKAGTIFAYRGSFPDKFHSLNQEMRYGDRVADMMTNDQSFQFVKGMSDSLAAIRKILYSQNYREFLTGILQDNFEGGQARSFSTHCNASDSDFYLSLTGELKLKRLLVSGFSQVFEIAQSFRNEGVDTMHSPEFTMLEAYASSFFLHSPLERGGLRRARRGVS
jgi:lysyl-tRNA synthetase class 2